MSTELIKKFRRSIKNFGQTQKGGTSAEGPAANSNYPDWLSQALLPNANPPLPEGIGVLPPPYHGTWPPAGASPAENQRYAEAYREGRRLHNEQFAASLPPGYYMATAFAPTGPPTYVDVPGLGRLASVGPPLRQSPPSRVVGRSGGKKYKRNCKSKKNKRNTKKRGKKNKRNTKKA